MLLILDLLLLPIWSDKFVDTQLVHVLALHNSFSFHLISVWQTILLFGCHIWYHITSLHSIRLKLRLAFFTQNLLVHSLKWIKPAKESCKNFRFEILDLPLLSITSDIFADTKLVHVLALHNSFSFHLILVWQTIFYLAFISSITLNHYILLGYDLDLLSLLRIS